MAAMRNRQAVPEDKNPFAVLLQQAKPVTDAITAFGFEYTFVPDYLLSQIAGNVQIRDIKNVAPLDRVLLYAEDMSRGQGYNPIVVSADHLMLDGHTRRGAALKIKRLTLPAFVLNRKYEDELTPQQRSVQNRMHGLGTALNQHGLPMTRREIRHQIELIGPNAGYDAARLAQLLHVQESFVQNIFAEMRARERFAEVKFEPARELTASQLRSLGRAQINNAPYKALCDLTEKANLTPTEIDHIRKEAKDRRDDDAALTYIQQEREARASQIEDFKAHGKADTSNALLLRQRLGFIRRFKGKERELCEHNPSTVAKHIADIKDAIEVLERVLDEQESDED
jgi:hypothetical protein